MVTTPEIGQQSYTSTTEAAQPLPDWYDKWRVRIQEWVTSRVDKRLASVILLVPDFFALMIRLLRDKRVSRRTKFSLLLSIGYVLLPFDLLPEMLFGVLGLVDDASVMGLTLFGITSLGKVDPAILRQHWSGNGDVVTAVGYVHRILGTNFFGIATSAIWKKFKVNFRSVQRK